MNGVLIVLACWMGFGSGFGCCYASPFLHKHWYSLTVPLPFNAPQPPYESLHVDEALAAVEPEPEPEPDPEPDAVVVVVDCTVPHTTPSVKHDTPSTTVIHSARSTASGVAPPLIEQVHAMTEPRGSVRAQPLHILEKLVGAEFLGR